MFVLNIKSTLMKKSYFPLLGTVLLTIFNSLNAQRFYVNASIGYGMPVGATTAGLFSGGNITIDMNNVYTYHSHAVTLSTGKNYEILAGFKLTPNVGIELAYSQLKGEKHTVDWNIYDETGRNEIHANTWRVSPSIVFFIPFKRAELYSKFGPNFGKGFMQNNYSWAKGKLATLNVLQEIQMNQSLGAYGAFGMNYKIFKNLSLNGEVNISMSSLFTESMEFKNYIEDGQDKLSEMSISDKQFVCKDSYVLDNNALVDQNAPSSVQRDYYSYNQIALKLGLRFSF